MATKDEKARASTIAQRNVYRKDRMADFKYTNSVMDSIFGNLTTTQKGFARSLTAANARQLAALEGLRARTANGTSRDMARASGTIGKLYGSAIRGASAPLLRQGDTHAEAANMTMRGEVRAGNVMSKGAQNLLAMVQAGATEAQAGAAAQTAEALRYRAKDDAKLIADRQAALQQAALQFKYWKKQQEYLANHPDGQAGGKAEGIATVADTAVTAGKTMRDFAYDNPGATVDELIAAAAEGDSTLAQDPNARAMLRQLAIAVKSSTHEVDGHGVTLGDYSRKDDAAAMMDAVMVLYPNYKGNETKLQQTILAGLNALYIQAQIDAADQALADAQNNPMGLGGTAGNMGDPGTYNGMGVSGAGGPGSMY